MLTPRGPYMSQLRGIYGTFGHHYINVREKFNRYKYIISFNSKIKGKNQGFHRNEKRMINWHGVKEEREISAQCSKY